METDTVVLNEDGKQKKGNNIIREGIAILFWMYILTKLFVFDFDIWVMAKFFPEYLWFLNYKSLFWLVLGTLMIVLFSGKKALKLSAFVLFYPFILILWRIPLSIAKKKSSVLVIAIINAVLSFFTSAKQMLLTVTVAFTLLVLAFTTTKPAVLWVVVIFLAILLFLVFINKIISVFRPSNSIKLFNEIMAFLRERTPDFLHDLEPVENDQEKWALNLQKVVLINRICLFSARKLRDYQDSGFHLVSYALNLMYLTIATIIIFTAMNYSLFGINASFYTFTDPPNAAAFFVYSFNNFVQSPLTLDLIPATPMTQIVALIQSYMFFIVITIIFGSILLAIAQKQKSSEWDGLIAELKWQGEQFETHIKEKYELANVGEAMVVLERLKADLVEVLFILSKGI